MFDNTVRSKMDSGENFVNCNRNPVCGSVKRVGYIPDIILKLLRLYSVSKINHVVCSIGTRFNIAFRSISALVFQNFKTIYLL